MNTPVLLIAFNRADTLMQVFAQVRKAQPPALYISVDGPREGNENDIQGISEVYKIKELVDWPCEVHTRFLNENLGCGYGPATAITWAFESCERLIVLEDDCVPSLSFFDFCDEMLEKYENDTRIGIVSGRSMLENSEFFNEQDYIFTHAAPTWGWATWKRCWLQYDIKMSDYPDFKKNGGCKNIIRPYIKALSRNRWYDKVYISIEEEVKHSWDSQWAYTRTKNGYLGIVPRVNLIENIGVNGTHLKEDDPNLKFKAGELLFPLKHPRFVCLNYKYERIDFFYEVKRKLTLKKIIAYMKRKFKNNY